MAIIKHTKSRPIRRFTTKGWFEVVARATPVSEEKRKGTPSDHLHLRPASGPELID